MSGTWRERGGEEEGEKRRRVDSDGRKEGDKERVRGEEKMRGVVRGEREKAGKWLRRKIREKGEDVK